MIDRIKNILGDLYKESYSKYPISNLCVLIMTLCLMFEFGMNNIMVIMGFFFIGCYFIEVGNRKNKLYYVVSFIISLLFWIVLKYFKLFVFYDFISKLAITYILCLILYTLYKSYKNSQKDFSQYLENVFRASVKLSFVYSLLALCILFIISIFNFLIIDIIDDDIIVDIEIFLCGMYYFSNLLRIFRGDNNNEGVFFKNLLRKVLNPLLYVSIIIIYLFIIRLFFDGGLEEDYVFYIVSYLFLYGAPLILMSESYKENSILDKINKYSSYLFIPFVLLQIYLLFIKYSSYGITEEVYLSILIIIFEIFYLFYNVLKKDVGNLFIVVIIMVIVTFIVPFINIDDLVLYSQYSNLEIYKNKTVYTENEMDKIYNSYSYLKYNDSEYMIKLNLTDEDIKIIKSFDKDNYIYDDDLIVDDYDYIDAYWDGVLNISGYDELHNVSINGYDLQLKFIDKLIVSYDNKSVEFDFKDLYNNYYMNKDNLDNFFESNNIILLDDKYKLILSKISISYKNGLISGYNINGYLLVNNHDTNDLSDEVKE